MLYLVRKLEESIIVNNEIEIKVVEIKKNSVKLGISFPSHCTVLRKELHDKISAENLKATQSIGILDGITSEIDSPNKEAKD